MNYENTMIFLYAMGIFVLGMGFSALITHREKQEDKRRHQEWKDLTKKGAVK